MVMVFAGYCLLCFLLSFFMQCMYSFEEWRLRSAGEAAAVQSPALRIKYFPRLKPVGASSFPLSSSIFKTKMSENVLYTLWLFTHIDCERNFGCLIFQSCKLDIIWDLLNICCQRWTKGTDRKSVSRTHRGGYLSMGTAPPYLGDIW